MADEWMSAAEALERVAGSIGFDAASRTICSRAYAGLIEARARRFVRDRKAEDNCLILTEFWWARGEAALKQNWAVGDFETWLDHKYHLLAYGVSFARVGIDAIAGPTGGATKDAPTPSTQIQSPRNPGGRPPATWWDDLWVEICRQVFVGDLQPTRQADIASAMAKWASDRGYDPADSTIRERARKLWDALNRDARN